MPIEIAYFMVLPGEAEARSRRHASLADASPPACGYLSVVSSVLRPVPDGGTDEAHRDARVPCQPAQEVFLLSQSGLRATADFTARTAFSILGPPAIPARSARSGRAEHDAGCSFILMGFIDQPVRGR